MKINDLLTFEDKPMWVYTLVLIIFVVLSLLTVFLPIPEHIFIPLLLACTAPIIGHFLYPVYTVNFTKDGILRYKVILSPDIRSAVRYVRKKEGEIELLEVYKV